jgi:hypothetical protein
MFGWKREAEELRARVADLERQVTALSAQLSATRPLLDDATRIESLARQAEAAVRTLESRATPLTLGTPRTTPRLDTLYRADVLDRGHPRGPRGLRLRTPLHTAVLTAAPTSVRP